MAGKAAHQSQEGRRAASSLPAARHGTYESELFYTHQLSILSRLLAKTTKDMLDPFGLSQMQWRVIVQLEHRSPSKIAEIQERCLVQKSQISLSMPPLIKRGLISRQNDPRDSRAPFFFLTEEGLNLYTAVMRKSRARQRALESVLPVNERRGFEAALRRLIESTAGGAA